MEEIELWSSSNYSPKGNTQRVPMGHPEDNKHALRVSFQGVAQLGSASVLGTESRRFKSCHLDVKTR